MTYEDCQKIIMCAQNAEQKVLLIQRVFNRPPERYRYLRHI